MGLHFLILNVLDLGELSAPFHPKSPHKSFKYLKNSDSGKLTSMKIALSIEG